MIKTYKLTTPVRNSSIVIRGKTGNSMRYNFSGGDPLTNKPATIILKTVYAQDLLEGSDLYKNGFVQLVRMGEGGEEVAKNNSATIIDKVVSPEQLIEFVAVNLDKVYQRPEAALEFAKRKGFEFPNLKLNKKEE